MEKLVCLISCADRGILHCFTEKVLNATDMHIFMYCKIKANWK